MNASAGVLLSKAAGLRRALEANIAMQAGIPVLPTNQNLRKELFVKFSFPASVMVCLLPIFSLRAGQVGSTSISNAEASQLPHSRATADSMKQASNHIAQADATGSQDGPSPSPLGPGPGCNLFPAPPSTGASVPLSYFGPSPSASNPSLVGPYQLLKSGTVDAVKGTITLPLYKGYLGGSKTPVWYILTDVDDANVATLLGLNYSAKLTFAARGARTARFNKSGDLVFTAGTVDFSPHRVLTPGSPNAFPPAVAQPGSVGDAQYSPLVRVLNAGGVIYNAPIIAAGDEREINFPDGNPDYTKVHDQVLALDTVNETVTLQLINGFSFGRQLWYISLDASRRDVAAIEGNTYAPLLSHLPTGKDDSFSSPVERIFIATNGAEDCANPQRQGLNAAITDGFRPNNTFGGIPTIATDYSPMWNAQLYEWTPDAIAKGYRGQLREEFQILTFVQDGLLTGPGGAPFGDSGFIINCPPVQRLQ